MTFKRAVLPLLAAWIAAGAPLSAAAEAPPRPGEQVQLEVNGCPDVSTAAVRRVLGIELGDLLLDAAAGEARDAGRLSIRCAGDFAFLEATGTAGEPATERILRLDDFPGDAAPRALALIGVELLAAHSAAVRQRIERRAVGAPPPPVEPFAGTPSALPLPAARREWRIGVAGLWQTFAGRDGAAGFGGRAQASATALRICLASADLELVTDRQVVSGVGQATAWLLSSGVTFGLFADRHGWRVAGALGGRIGLVRESGSSADPARIASATFVRPWAGPILSASLSRALGPVALRLSSEAGWSLLSIDETAAGSTAIAVHGAWLALAAGADFRVR